MTRLSRFWSSFFIVSGLICWSALAAQTAPRAEILFATGQRTAAIDGNLQSAIDLFRQAAAAAGANRALAARATLEMANCYARLHDVRAQQIYREIQQKYADQREIAAEATAALANQIGQPGPLTNRRAFSSPTFRLSDLSADGKIAVGTELKEDGSLAILDLRKGTERTLVRAVAGGGTVYDSRLSPDGKWVAFTWYLRNWNSSSTSSPQSLQIVSTDAGAAPRTLLEGWSVTPRGWSSDGRRILVQLVPQRGAASGQSLAWINVADGASTTLTSFSAVPADGGALSPDGRFIAFSARPAAGSQANDRHIHVINADGSGDAEIVIGAGANTSPHWTPDGTQLLFVSDQSGTRALWSQPMKNGRPAGEARVVLTPFTDALVGVTTSGDIYASRVQESESWVLIGERSATSSRVLHSFLGRNATLSPDGASAAFVRESRTGSQLIVRTLASGAERRLGPDPVDGLGWPKWLPDGSAVIVHAFPPGGDRVSGSLYRVDIADGATKLLFPTHAADHERVPGIAISPDGKTAYAMKRAAWQGPPTPATGRGAGSEPIGVVAIDLATGTERTVVPIPADEIGRTAFIDLTISPDGRTLALQALAGPNQPGIYLIGLDGTPRRKLVAVGGRGTPAWTPDGQAVLVGRLNDRGAWEIDRVPVAGGPPVFDSMDLSKATGALPSGDTDFRKLGGIGLSTDARATKVVFTVQSPPTNEIWVFEKRISRAGSRQTRHNP